MVPLLLRPATKNYFWGGSRLKSDFSIESDDAILAEAWMLSCHPDGNSTIMNGPLKGMALADALLAESENVLGQNNATLPNFPILIKLIDTASDLSIQVHPDDVYATDKEGVFGKTEMWYVLDAREDAYLYCGFSREISKEEMQKRIEENTILEVLNRVSVEAGDVLFIEAGTIHSIGAGILLAEIQQNSNTTYRVYDYDRTDPAGNKRDLHIQEALEVTHKTRVTDPVKRPAMVQMEGYSIAILAACPHFTVDLISVDEQAALFCGGESFASLIFIEGEGSIVFRNNAFGKTGVMQVSKGDSLFLPAGTGAYEIQGKCKVLRTVR